MDTPFSILIAANNEAGYIGACLAAVLDQDASAGLLDVVVAANGCTDATVQIVTDHIPRFAARGWSLTCLELATPGKVAALSAAETAARSDTRAYLDADVICDPALFGQLRTALDTEAPRYATGRLVVAPARSAITRAYGAFWQQTAFVQAGAVGAGLFAVNGAGRALCGAFPDIISDDTFVRLQFSPDQRIEVPAPYHWPMIEGWRALVRVRRRQDAGVREIARLYPALIARHGRRRLAPGALVRLALRHPIRFAVYASVALAVRARPASSDWTRGR